MTVSETTQSGLFDSATELEEGRKACGIKAVAISSSDEILGET